MGMTLAQKILARAAGKEFVEPGQYIVPTIDVAMLTCYVGGSLCSFKRSGDQEGLGSGQDSLYD